MPAAPTREDILRRALWRAAEMLIDAGEHPAPARFFVNDPDGKKRQTTDPAELALYLERTAEPEGAIERPKIVCLCGSTRFMDHFHELGWQFTLHGYIVLSVGVSKHQTIDGGHVGEALGGDVAARLDELHFRKIDLADSVFVLNVGGYIGASTRREIEYAKAAGKPIEYLEETGF